MQFWLFTMRAVANDNPSLPNLKQLFVKFSGCLSSGGQTGQTNQSPLYTMHIKRDYIFLEFLKVAQESILLNMFDTFEEAA